MAISLNVSVDELTELCRNSRTWLMPAVDGPRYPLDIHWAVFVLNDIQTMADAEVFMESLGGDRCAKVRAMRRYFEKPFWQETPARIRYALAANRRIGCSCHETGSFAPKR